MKRLALALILVSAVFAIEGCDTPEKCYDKATTLFNQNRVDFNNRSSTINDLYAGKINEYQKIVDELKAVNQSLKDRFNKNKAILDAYKKDGSIVDEKLFFMYQRTEAFKFYDDIFQALNSGIITKGGNPIGWDQTTFSSNLWKGKKMICIGNTVNSIGNGLNILVPSNAEVIWLRLHGDEWATLRTGPVSGKYFEFFSAGKRGLNEISPDGTTLDSYSYSHQWVPIPVRREGDEDASNFVYSIVTSIGNNVWVSGIAFGSNLWNHAKDSAVGYYWKNNGGSDVEWDSDNWNNDVLGRISKEKLVELIVPVISNGKDKLFYLIEHNNNWSGVMHSSIYANSHQIERFRTTYQNPFATHANSKYYNRYISAKIPSYLIGKHDTHVSIKIDMTSSDNSMFFREAGTHDFN